VRVIRINGPSRLLAISLLLTLPGCGPSEAASTDDESHSRAAEIYDESAPVELDEDAARTDAGQEVASEGYSGPCTSDCSGHDAGFDWSADGHEDYGTSRSPSFDEGQEAYQEAVDQRVEDKRQEFEDEGADSDYAMSAVAMRFPTIGLRTNGPPAALLARSPL
jgi:hypothetical protein